MTDQEINSAIAESSGNCLSKDRKSYYVENYCWQPLMNYCDDLNAMHDAEKTLKYKEKESFHSHLAVIMPGAKPRRGNSFMWHSTARQRAEAFLRVKGKWVE